MRQGAWRIVKARHAPEAFGGEGARRYGGRWTSPGQPVVYAAEHASLAILEMLVHLGSARSLSAYIIIQCDFEERLVERVPAATLAAGWRDSPPPQSLRAIGDRWLAESRSAVLEVPSAVVPMERNYLLNPLHPDFARVVIGEQQAFHFDPRLA